MALQHLPEMTVFCAELPNGTRKHFTFAEWVGWFALYDKPLSEADQGGWFFSFCGQDANDARIMAWQKVHEDWRKQVEPDDERRRRSYQILLDYTDT